METESRTGTADLSGAHSHSSTANLPQDLRPIREQAHRAETTRFQLAWYEPAAFRRALQPIRPAVRWIRTSLLGTGLLCLIGVRLIILLAARTLSCYVTVGPRGVSRIKSTPMGHHAMVQRWQFPWKEIEELLYVEDCPLGGRGWWSMPRKRRATGSSTVPLVCH
jgi:hypothetical protein